MANNSAIIEINKLVDTYLLKKRLPQDDFFMYLQHACDCFRKINIRHSNDVITAKVSVSALGIIEWPSDMINYGALFVPIEGEWWSFTKKGRKVMTTTMTNGVEGQDSNMGEGVDVLDDTYTGIGGRGGVNAYYVNVDEKNRRLFCDGFKSDTAVLQYSSSGLVVSGSTYVPTKCISVIDSYLDWQRELVEPRSMAMIQTLKSYYDDNLQELRLINFLPSRDEIADIWDGNSTLGIQR